MNLFKDGVLAAIGAVGSVIAAMLGGWNAALTTLLIMMAVDYITGMMLAGVFHKSTKTSSGKLESAAGFKGLCRKGMTFLMVLIGAQIEMTFSVGFIKDAVIIAYIVNEAISIIENAALMGLPVPGVIAKAIDALSTKAQ